MADIGNKFTLIAALAKDMAEKANRAWADEIAQAADQIISHAQEIKQEAARRRSGER